MGCSSSSPVSAPRAVAPPSSSSFGLVPHAVQAVKAGGGLYFTSRRVLPTASPTPSQITVTPAPSFFFFVDKTPTCMVAGVSYAPNGGIVSGLVVNPWRQAAPAPPKAKTDKLKEDADKVFFQATFHWHHGELPEAHRLCSKAIDVFPKHKRAFLLRCEVLLKLGRWDEATEDATAAIGLGHKEGHRTRGHVQVERGRFRDAVAAGPDPTTYFFSSTSAELERL